MSLFAAGVVLFLLLVASYSGRRLWISLASTVMSMAALAGLLFVAIAKEPDAIRGGLLWTAGKIELVVDQPTADTIAKVIERLPAPVRAARNAPSTPAASPPVIAEAPSASGAAPFSCEDGQTGCGAPGAGATQPQPGSPAQASIQAAATPGLSPPVSVPPPAPPPTVKTTQGSPVVWFLDEQAQAAANAAAGLVISGMNASSSAFEDVRAVLKPDGGHDELPLVVEVEGQQSDGVVPAGVRFSLALQNAERRQTGGAILSFRYRQGAEVRTSILYLTPAMIARLANRG